MYEEGQAYEVIYRTESTNGHADSSLDASIRMRPEWTSLVQECHENRILWCGTAWCSSVHVRWVLEIVLETIQ